MKDPYNLARFVLAQKDTYAQATAELAAGHKFSHWMWFIFPQLRGLGRSPMAQHYGLSGLDEARAYLEHPELGPRLWTCTKLMVDAAAPSLSAILGADDVKFRSSMTLFAEVAPDSNSIFHRALNKWCQGIMDQRSLDLLYRHTPA